MTPQQSLPVLLFLLLPLLLTPSTSTFPTTIVQGFYWQTQGEYSHSQRRALISQLQKGSIYIHLPQLAETLEVWNSSQLAEWQVTKNLCVQRGVMLVVGVRTFRIGDLDMVLYKVEKKIRQLDLPFVLGWDDCQDGQTNPQKTLQLQLLQKLTRKPWAIVPGAYYAQDGNIEAWVQRLSIINDADKSIPFILCSKNGINPDRMNPVTDFPSLGRKIIFWDNWMAVDQIGRFPRNLPSNRDARLFDQKEYGYMLNLCFPPQRIIHGLKSIPYQQKSQPYNYKQISHSWASYLMTQKFITESDRLKMQEALYELMYHYDGTMDVKEIVQQYPILGKFLYSQEMGYQ